MRRHQCHPDPLALARRRRSERGLSLVELMLSASLGVLLLGAAVAVLLAAGRMRRNQQLLSDANDVARAALRVVSNTVGATGVGGKLYRYVSTGGDVRQRSALIFTNGTTALNAPTLPQKPDSLIVMRYGADRRSELVAELNSGFPVRITPDPRQASTKGVEPQIFRPGEHVFITNFQTSMLLRLVRRELNTAAHTVDLDVGTVNFTALQPQTSGGMSTEPKVNPGASVFPVQLLRYRVVYVPAKGSQPERGDLVAETLDPITLAPLTTVVLASNVEDFQVQWANSNGDGVAQGYSDIGPTETNIDQDLAYARISISARTSGTLITNSGDFVAKGEMTPFEQGLDLDTSDRPPASGYRRRVLSTVVLLKNLAALRL